MLISYKWLKELVDFEMEPAGLENILTMLGIEVEGIIDYSEKYKNFFVAEVTSCEKHPDADKLSVCEVKMPDKESTVICGAPNVASGQKVILGIPGAVVPQAGFKLEKRKIRGVKSEGMICSEAELDLGTDAGGILVLPDDAEPGKTLVEYMNLDDIVFDVTLTPNRPDALSHIGVARDIAAYFGKKLNKPQAEVPEKGEPVENHAQVEIADTENCPRYAARVVKGVKIGESPDWMKQRLVRVGMRPINVIVDITNYVLMECGQPLHAFDLNLLTGNQIVVRQADAGDKFTTLDSKEHTLSRGMLMICDAAKPVAVAGVMGGENSEINDDTTDILIESAFFNPTSVRKTAKKLGIQSESSYRFERGADIDNVIYAADRAAQLIAEYAGGTVSKGVIDAYPKKVQKRQIDFRYKRARQIIGLDLREGDMLDMLERLTFNVIDKGDHSALIEVPHHRVDVTLEIDLIEEIARLYNYDKIEPDFTSNIDFTRESLPMHLAVPELRQRLREFLVPKGYIEILTQNMIDPKSAEIFTDKPVMIANPLGEELSVMRPSMVPSVLKTIERNIRIGNLNQSIFEIGKIFQSTDKNEDTFIPGFREKEILMIARCGNAWDIHWGAEERPVDFYDIKGVYEEMTEFFGWKDFELEKASGKDPAFSGNSLVIKHDGNEIGIFGELKDSFLEEFEINSNVMMLLMDASHLYKLPGKSMKYTKVSPYPAVIRDVAFVLDKNVNAGLILEEIESSGSKLLREVKVFDVYKGESIGEGKKSIAYSLKFSSHERTLVDEEVDSEVDKIVKAVENKFEAQLRKF